MTITGEGREYYPLKFEIVKKSGQNWKEQWVNLKRLSFDHESIPVFNWDRPTAYTQLKTMIHIYVQKYERRQLLGSKVIITLGGRM